MMSSLSEAQRQQTGSLVSALAAPYPSSPPASKEGRMSRAEVSSIRKARSRPSRRWCDLALTTLVSFETAVR